MSKLVITNGVVSVRVDGKVSRSLARKIQEYGATISRRSMERIMNGQNTTTGFALVERPLKARTERKERVFEVTEAYATARVRGKYKAFLELIAKGENTMSKLCAAIATATDPAENLKQVKWVRHEVCRALNSGFIVEEGNPRVTSEVTMEEVPVVEENTPEMEAA